MVREEDDEENEGEDEDVVGKGTVLRVQPSCITGGKMRCVLLLLSGVSFACGRLLW